MPAMEGGVGVSAAGAGQPVAEGGTILASPFVLPCEAVSLSESATVDRHGVAGASPLLESAVALCKGGAATSEASL